MKSASDFSPQPLVPSPFSLHPSLEADTFYAGDLSLSRVLLMNNANFPWLILVPRVTLPLPVGAGEGMQEGILSPRTRSHRERGDVSELFELSTLDQQQLLKEITFVSEAMKKIFSADKMNIAMLGNQVPQLHCHVIARFKGDKAWPNPVWGGASQKYTETQKEEVLAKLSAIFPERLVV